MTLHAETAYRGYRMWRLAAGNYQFSLYQKTTTSHCPIPPPRRVVTPAATLEAARHMVDAVWSGDPGPLRAVLVAMPDNPDLARWLAAIDARRTDPWAADAVIRSAPAVARIAHLAGLREPIAVRVELHELRTGGCRQDVTMSARGVTLSRFAVQMETGEVRTYEDRADLWAVLGSAMPSPSSTL